MNSDMEYKGKKVSPETTKKRTNVSGIDIRVDRPKGTIMRGVDKSGKSWERTYRYDYGFIHGTMGGDKDGLDVFIGPSSSKTTYWAIQKKDDGKFDEYKVFLNFPSIGAARKAYEQHIPKKYLHRMVAMSVDMMKALLGINPKEKLAMVFFMDELSRGG